MKFLGLSLILIGILLAPMARAQEAKPVANSDSHFKATTDNLKGTAMLGAFVDSMRRASTYRGHFVMTKTKIQDGKAFRQHTIDWKSVWQGDGDGNVEKAKSDVDETIMERGVTAKYLLQKVDDGTKVYRYNPSSNLWSEESHQPNTPDFSNVASALSWLTTLMAISHGDEFILTSRVAPGMPTKTILSSKNGKTELGFDTQSGYLESWKIISDEEITELRWLDLELNASLPDSTWNWKVPNGAQEVPPAQLKKKFEF